jgi:hypothetical protein
MTNQIDELPTRSNYGHGFNYAVWSANTTVTLANVRWDNTYKDVVTFGAGGNPALWRQRLDNYIDNLSGPVTMTTGVTYAAFGRPIRLQIPFEVANTYNYLRAYNPAQPLAGGGDRGRAYYYFVVGVNYIAPDTTELLIQLDAFASFGPDTAFGNIHVDRGHLGIANESAFAGQGRDFLTVPEGFDLGNEYVVNKYWSMQVGSARFNNEAIGFKDYAIMVVSSTALDEDPGTVDAPKLSSAQGSEMENLPNGAEIYLFNTLEHFKLYMEAMKDKPWVTQGIMEIRAVPRLQRYDVQLESKQIAGLPIDRILAGTLKSKKTAVVEDWRNKVSMPARYAKLFKLWTYPYMVVEMTSNTGTPLVLKPECWQDDHMDVVEVPHFAPPNARLGFYPYRYNVDTSTPVQEDADGIIHDGGEHYAMMTGIMNFPAFSVVNNGYMMFAASNANNIAYQHSSADWSQQRALAGADTAANQASSSMLNANNQTAYAQGGALANTNIANEAQTNHMMVNGAFGVAGGIARGAAMGPMGALTGGASGALNWAQSGLNTAIDMNARNQSLGANNAMTSNMLGSNMDNAGYVRDTNKALAEFSAQGDYANAIAGINAKVQDAKLTQPTTAGQVGGDAFNLATYRWGVDLKVKMLQPQVMAAIGEFWLRYGYAVNRFTKMPASLMVMDKFTYWKCKEVYVTDADCPETFKQTLRGIFEKGVTVWNNPNDIGNVDTATNTPLAGVQI